jgi:hypothetical protein
LLLLSPSLACTLLLLLPLLLSVLWVQLLKLGTVKGGQVTQGHPGGMGGASQPPQPP